MLEKLRFYTRHSLNDMRVNKQRTLFALLCIAAGVAAIVSLQTLGVMIEDSLTGSVQDSNKGDIRISAFSEEDTSDEIKERGKTEGVILEDSTYAMEYFSLAGIEQITDWFAEHAQGSVLTYRQAYAGPVAGAIIKNPRNEAEQTFVTPYIVDADRYPLYGSRDSEHGESLGELLQAPTDIVISRNLADSLDAQIGETLTLTGATESFTLRGIVATKTEGGFDNITGNIIGYYYVDLAAIELFDDALPPGGTEIYVMLADPSQVDEINEQFEHDFPYLFTQSTTELKDQNEQISSAVNQMVVIMGLVSLLLGGIGIVNTMLVIVNRRTTEIAVLKTIGLEAGQVTVLFLVEAVLMGIAGSLLGIVIGWIAAYGIKSVAETFLSQSLSYRITATPAITGFIVGVIVTTIFGFIPTLAAGQVRPNLVLRPTESVFPRAGRARSFAALLVVMLSISLVAQPLINELLDAEVIRTYALMVGAGLGLLLALTLLGGGLLAGWTRRSTVLRTVRWLFFLVGLPALGGLFGYMVPALLILLGTFIISGVLYALLWVLIWIVGRFTPSAGIPDVKLALRSMLSSKGRGASTLLALVIGVYTLSLITMLATAISKRFEQLMVDEVGGNVVVFAAGTGDTLDQVKERLATVPGVNNYSAVGTYDVSLLSVQDVDAGRTLSVDDLRENIRVEKENNENQNAYYDEDSLRWMLGGIDARETTSNLPDVKFYDGRQLTAADTGPWDAEAGDYPPIVIGADYSVIATGIEVGDLLTFELTPNMQQIVADEEPRRLTFEVVGMVDRRQNITVNFGSPSYSPINAFPADAKPNSVAAIVDVEEDQIRAVRRAMNDIPLAFVLETRLLNDLINRILDQFTSFPILVAGLALVVGGIVIANSVALSTLERRREIAVMKAVGVQRERALGMILLEYGLMGLIGGLIGVGLGAVALLAVLVQIFSGDLGRSIPYVTALELMLLCIAIALLAAITTAWRASGEKPLNVLRYE